METKRTRRTFTHEFKKQAAERVIVGKEKATAVAQDLGINPVSLYQWIKEFDSLPATSSTQATSAPSATPEQTVTETTVTEKWVPDASGLYRLTRQSSASQPEGESQTTPAAKAKAEPPQQTREPISDASTKAQPSLSAEHPLPTNKLEEKKQEANNGQLPERQREGKQEAPTQPEGFQIKYCTIHPSEEDAIKAGQHAQAPESQMPSEIEAVDIEITPPPAPAPKAKSRTLNLPIKNKRNDLLQERREFQERREPQDRREREFQDRREERRELPERREFQERRESQPQERREFQDRREPSERRDLQERREYPERRENQERREQQDRRDFTSSQPYGEAKRRPLAPNEQLTEKTLEAPSEYVSDYGTEVPRQPQQDQYSERNGREQNREYKQDYKQDFKQDYKQDYKQDFKQDYKQAFKQQKQRKYKQFNNDKYQNRNELDEIPPEKPVPEKPPRPVPTAAEGRVWTVRGALGQRPNYREENEKHGYVDEFKVPGENLEHVWQILEIMQETADKRAFADMVHARQLNVPPEVLEDPKACTVQGPNIPNKPWLRKPKMNPVAEEFFQTTPEYAKAVYENYCGLDIRLDKNSDGTPILSVQEDPLGDRIITIDFSKFDRFVDDFYGDFVKECKEVMMRRNPREYSSLNSFIRIPDEPLWNPKLWAGVRTFPWKQGESLSEAWINYASSIRKNQRYR